ncbi:catechol 2,3-dioxygenase-like lactoylglutathione lyase family enzyme [Caldalkalibacillus uzonensis]|uniref:Catechol 2,3-dioxygenase-like lactoylglutathione lyase family enzyme n=1 Tax=Caldalkalibacillus uzonensis TaxID=353224 RepID=A0ABU0CQD0_9BACI|nr:VOC family protein [Caldalkalibacillus uzonensis]MDQ0338617.1 catechol 2,3-dioxygenase-like lactoylglutathione lyase family enzyme [Caldalkalibacillus uzonensis]
MEWLSVIEVERFHHVSLSVTDLNKAKHFYGTVLGFTEIKRPDFDFPGAWYQIGDTQLHLIVYPQSETLRTNPDIQTKEGHFAIRVKDYYKTLEYLKQKGVPLLEKPRSKSGFAQIFCTDPDGNLIEFNVDQSDLNL